MVMIAQIQNLRNFIQSQLADVIDPSRHVTEDQEKRSTGDHAFIVIKTAFNRYKISVASAYVEPPAGAPLECRSLGTVTFIDLADGKQIVGPKADKTYADISRHIHLRELGDTLADGRRRLAEAAPHEVASIRARVAEIVAKAKKWGIEPNIPDLPRVEIATEGVTEGERVNFAAPGNWTPQEQAALRSDRPPVVTVADIDPVHGDRNKRAPFPGCPVVWITNPGEAIGGMTEIPGICAKVISPDRISVFVIPDHSEPSYRDNLMRRGSDAGNGRTHQYNCWDFNPAWLAEQARIKALEDEVKRTCELFREAMEDGARTRELFREAVDRLSDGYNDLAGRIIALEAQAKRGADKPAMDKMQAELATAQAAQAPQAPAAGKRKKSA